MSTTKYNIERQFIEGYDIVDSIDQASFQKQVELEFTGDTVIIDLSSSNFFLIDCELCSGGVCNFNIQNLGNTQRFEILLQESLDVKSLNFFSSSSPQTTVHFPFVYTDDEDNEYIIEPMQSERRNQMLITFRVSKKSTGELKLIGIPTPWFESAATHSMLNIRIEELANATPDTEDSTHDFAYRYPSNIQIECYNSHNESIIIDLGESSFGIFTTFIYRIPEYYTNEECQHHIKITYNGQNGGEIIIPISKDIVNTGMINIPIQLPDNFINEWEPSHGKDYHQTSPSAFTFSAMFYREGDIVKHNAGFSGQGSIWRCNTDLPTIRNYNFKPGHYDPLNSPPFPHWADPSYEEQLEEWHRTAVIDYLFWDRWMWAGDPDATSGTGWYKMILDYPPQQLPIVQWEFINPQHTPPPL